MIVRCKCGLQPLGTSFDRTNPAGFTQLHEVLKEIRHEKTTLCFTLDYPSHRFLPDDRCIDVAPIREGPGGPSTVTIPFAFQTEQRKMPTGVYQISKASDNLVLLRGPNHVGAIVLVHAAIAQKAPAQGSVVFHRYGEMYFLGEFWTASSKTGAECFKGHAEKEMILAWIPAK